jgi:hypothetical protein
MGGGNPGRPAARLAPRHPFSGERALPAIERGSGPGPTCQAVERSSEQPVRLGEWLKLMNLCWMPLLLFISCLTFSSRQFSTTVTCSAPRAVGGWGSSAPRLGSGSTETGREGRRGPKAHLGVSRAVQHTSTKNLRAGLQMPAYASLNGCFVSIINAKRERAHPERTPRRRVDQGLI